MRLSEWLREAKGRTKLVGICFGHQVMAQAFGGNVAKADKGCGIGPHRYDVHERASWTDDAASFAIPVSPQDQFVEPPPGLRLPAGTDFSPSGLYASDETPPIPPPRHP